MLHSDTIVRHNDYTNENPLSDRRSVSAPTFLVSIYKQKLRWPQNYYSLLANINKAPLLDTAYTSFVIIVTILVCTRH